MVNRIFALLIGIILTLSTYGQTPETNEWILRQKLPDWFNFSFNKLKLNSSYKISDYINPFYLEADFNGDNTLDIAVAIEQKETNKKGFVVLHAGREDFFIIGAGNPFGNGGDNFNWMDIWKVYRNQGEQELTYNADSEIEGSRAVRLKNTGIYVEKSESAGGLIYWDSYQYVWNQAGD